MMMNEINCAPPRAARQHQQGVVLLALILVVLVGSSAVLLGKLNERARAFARDVQTHVALKQAKQALLQYAMNYPELQELPERGPGYLPCPDQDNDGIAESNCAESTGSTLGWLPTKDLEVDALTDSSGEQLWYAVSDNFKNKIQLSDHVLNSDTPGTLSVDGADDIVAVLIAPGSPLTWQSGRRGAGEAMAISDPSTYLHSIASEYLEGDNATSSFSEFVTSATGEFNDSVITISRSELMKEVETRVANEVRAMLEYYRDEYGSYPWLAPFADPKVSGRYIGTELGSLGASARHPVVLGYAITGEHDGVNGSTQLLVDESGDDLNFEELGVQPGDRVWNIDDGSTGVVTGVTEESIDISAGMSIGANNFFDTGDRYLVQASKLPALFEGTAGDDSNATTLDAGDTEFSFERRGIVPGDIVENLQDLANISIGKVISVDGMKLTLTSLTGGTYSAFTESQPYRIRSAFGITSVGSSGNTIEDSAANFPAMGVQAADVIKNLTSGSVGIVEGTVGIPNADSLTTTTAFDDLHFYAISRNNGKQNTTSGLIPIHEPGKAFQTGFTFDWTVSCKDDDLDLKCDNIGSAASPDSCLGILSEKGGSPPIGCGTQEGTSLNYTLALTTWIKGALPVEIPDGYGFCTWISSDVADCAAAYTDSNFFSGIATGVLPTSLVATRISDSSKKFGLAGIKRGDIFQKLPSGPRAIVTNNPGTSSTNIRVISIAEEALFTIIAGESYRVRPASGMFTGTVLSKPGANQACVDPANDLSAIHAEDIIYKTPGTYRYGKIKTEPSGGCIEYTDLTATSGTVTDLSDGEQFTVVYDHVATRNYTINSRMTGAQQVASVEDRRVCQGYTGNECENEGTSTLSIDDANFLISIEDRDDANDLVGSATADLIAGSAGSVRMSGMNYMFVEDEDGGFTDAGFLPQWFLRNRWQEYVYVTYSNAFAPGGDGSCTVGTDPCISFNKEFPEGAGFDDREAVVIVAGEELDDPECADDPTAALSRTGIRNPDEFTTERITDSDVLLCAYLDGSNSNGDSEFDQSDATNSFNDKIIAIGP